MKTVEDFEGGVAVVTGAGSGIGEGIGRCAASLGMKVVIADIAIDRAEAVAADIRAQGGEARAFSVDVGNGAALDRLADEVYGIFGEVTLLVNNAGIKTIGRSWELDRETWDRNISINVLGAVHGVRAFLPRMLAAGKKGYISNISSIGALGMMPAHSTYIASKHALQSFTECLYLELAMEEAPIHVSAVLPGPVITRIYEDAVTADVNLQGHRKAMKDMLDVTGIKAIDAGRIIMEGIVAEQFWISTHPDLTATMAHGRADYLMKAEKPSLSAQMRAALDH